MDHLDLLLERASNEEYRLLAFRLPPESVLAPGSVFLCTPAESHRALYLDYEGALSRERGEVRRVAEGACCVNCEEPDRVKAHLWPSGAAQGMCIEIRKSAGAAWSLQCENAE
ncbi:MAG: hypothetical protein KF866_03915 [Phycisphaeraceae bacterium]|nr:hypothetical protein [Phycisphaeraceae bacterium]MCW5753160.1 hypothetical protein [Phycisphaeraceae bacterium]